MQRLFFRIYRKLSFIYSKIFRTNFDSEKIENYYFSFIKKIQSSGSHNINNHKIYFNLNSDVTKRLILDKSFEKEEINCCLKYITSDSVIIDIGANIGLHTVNYSLMARDGIVFAFEPSRSTFKHLVNNIRNLNNVIALNMAVSDKTDMTEFYVAEDDAYSSLKDTKRKKIQNTENVIVYDLNSFFLPLHLPKIDFVKIDVEGFEYEVLKGMDKLLISYKPILFVEIYRGINSNEIPEETIQFIINMGYIAMVMQEGELINFESHDDNYHNYFFFPTEKTLSLPIQHQIYSI